MIEKSVNFVNMLQETLSGFLRYFIILYESLTPKMAYKSLLVKYMLSVRKNS